MEFISAKLLSTYSKAKKPLSHLTIFYLKCALSDFTTSNLMLRYLFYLEVGKVTLMEGAGDLYLNIEVFFKYCFS